MTFQPLLELGISSDIEYVERSLVMTPDERARAIVLYHEDLADPFGDKHSAVKIRDILLIQPGLPGIDWRIKMERKAGELIASRRDLVVAILIPKGIKKGPRFLNIGRSDLSDVSATLPEMVESAPFEMELFLEELRHLTLSVRETLHQLLGGKLRFLIHLVGHSYGASSVLNLLSSIRSNDLPELSSVNFLAPFVKTGLKTKDQKFRLDIHNNAVLLEARTQKSPEARLREMLAECVGKFSVADVGNLMEQHRAVFVDSFFTRLLQIKRARRKPIVRTFLGGRDENIGQSHADLIGLMLGRNDVTVFEKDDHTLQSLDMEALLPDL